jgi:hypothetical protein
VRTRGLNVAAIGVVTLLSVSAASGKFAHVWEPVPTDRLLTNVSRYVREHPKDARGHYTLGRIHAMIYSEWVARPKAFEVVLKDWNTQKPLPVPEFPPYSTVQVKPPAVDGPLPADLRAHLAASLGEYRWAVTVDPKEPLYQLGYAWMLDQGAPRAPEMPEVAREAGIAATEDAFRQRALEMYRKAYLSTIKDELARKSRNMNAGDHSIATEAGEGIVGVLNRRKNRSSADWDEIAKIKGVLDDIGRKPGMITPLIFSAHPRGHIGDMLGGTTRFDLAANGKQEQWPWVKPDTGIIVWDPDRTGRIVSGRQLFGSRTWQMFWRNGYEALAALDDDSNGWLDGRELAGIAVWFDRNGNGRSDKGEVTPVAALGITRICCRPDGVRDGVPWSETGIELANGKRVATWDWTPESLPEQSPPPRALSTWN